MVKMAGQQQPQQQQQQSYSSLMVAVKREAEERCNAETYANLRARRTSDNCRPSSFQPRNIYYNSNHRAQHQTHFMRPPPALPRRQSQHYYNNYDRIHHHHPHQPIRPLMEIKDNVASLRHDFDDDKDDHDNDLACQAFGQRQPTQRGQYRNRKAELDWDHAFDLDLIDLYTANIDVDRHSLTSTISSSDHSFSSV